MSVLAIILVVILILGVIFIIYLHQVGSPGNWSASQLLEITTIALVQAEIACKGDSAKATNDVNCLVGFLSHDLPFSLVKQCMQGGCDPAITDIMQKYVNQCLASAGCM